MQSTERRAISVAVVAGIHVLAIYALATGLASQLVQKGLEEIKAEVVQEKPPDMPKTPPPPPPELQKPPPPFVPPPDINLQTQSTAPAITQVTTTITPPPPPAPPAAKPAPVITTPVSVGKAHECQSKYPPLAMRLAHEGTVVLGMTVNVDGSVSNVHVVQSSGHDELDQGAVGCASSWHYKPATEGNQPITHEWQASVKYKLTG
ncbi:MAG: TonB family protein [Alphaproteobacteria bacterium]|nr:TonB family protein [Alphaproteobacteria bacterium]